MKMKRPPTVRDDIYTALEGGEMGGEGGEMGMDQMAARAPQGPSFAPKAATAGRIRRGEAYETGDPDVDEFARKKQMEGPDQDEAFPIAYESQGEADRMIRGAYQAGVNGDDEAIKPIIYGPYGKTPLGKLMRRAYEEGRAKRGSSGRR